MRILRWLHWSLELAACAAALLGGAIAAVVLAVLGDGRSALIAAGVAAAALVYGVVLAVERPWADEDV